MEQKQECLKNKAQMVFNQLLELSTCPHYGINYIDSLCPQTAESAVRLLAGNNNKTNEIVQHLFQIVESYRKN